MRLLCLKTMSYWKGFTSLTGKCFNSGKFWNLVWVSISYETKKRKVHYHCTGIKAFKNINYIKLGWDIYTVWKVLLFPRHFTILTMPIVVQDHATYSTFVLKIDQATDNTLMVFNHYCNGKIWECIFFSKTKSLYNPPGLDSALIQMTGVHHQLPGFPPHPVTNHTVSFTLNTMHPCFC